MTVMQIYERLLGYSEEERKTDKWYYGLCNGMATVHRIGSNDTYYYVIHENGNVTVYNKYDPYYNERITIADLPNTNDFEFYSSVQTLKSGYLKFNSNNGNNSILNAKVPLTHILNKIESFDTREDICDKISDNVPRCCGSYGLDNGLTDGFQYTDINGIEVHLNILPRLCRENSNRTYYGAKVYPFNPNIKSHEAVYIYFVAVVSSKDTKELKCKCNESLKRLIEYCKEVGVSARWVDMNLSKPIYL